MKYSIFTLILGIILSAFLLAGCKREIDFDYHSVDKLYVIEGYLTNNLAAVSILQTRDVTDSVLGKTVKGAVVTLSSSSGQSEVLTYRNDGFYRSTLGTRGVPGTTYTLKVQIDDNQYISSSTMQNKPTIASATFKWVKMLSDKMLFYQVNVQDIPGEVNYYCYRVYRNNKVYRWNVFKDISNPGGTIPLNIACMSKQQADDNKEEDKDDILYEGDEIYLELQSIDRRAYDYLYSLRVSERTAANPIDNFSGGCLGYFSAYYSVWEDTIFKYTEIEDAE